jgi:tetratricopeptide (TPR) repeat protein
MLGRPSNLILAVAIAGIIGLAPARAQAPAGGATGQKNWKDRTEYDLFEAARTGKDPKANLEKLDQWKKSYPQTDFLGQRQQLYLANYVAAGQIPNAINTAKEILATDPNNFQALYYITLYTMSLVPPGSATVPPEICDQGEKAAAGMIANLDKQKPANMSDADWAKTRQPIEAVAHTTIGWCAMMKKDYDKAETEFKQSLTLNPNNGQVAYWLGVSIAAQKKPEKGSEFLFYFARAASYDGQGAVAPAVQKAALDYFQKAYATFHGSKDGADQVLALAKTNPAPPPGFKIASVVDIAKDQQAKEEAAAKANPSLALWKQIKEALTGPMGDAYFGSNMKDALLPTFTGKVVSLEPATKPKKIVLAIEDGTTPDATLEFEAALPGKVDPGTELSFEGVPSGYTASPFMVTFKVEKDKLHGWTGTNPAPARRPVHKPAAK